MQLVSCGFYVFNTHVDLAVITCPMSHKFEYYGNRHEKKTVKLVLHCDVSVSWGKSSDVKFLHRRKFNFSCC